LIKYIKSVLWRVVKRLSYIEDARCLKVKPGALRGSSDLWKRPTTSPFIALVIGCTHGTCILWRNRT